MLNKATKTEGKGNWYETIEGVRITFRNWWHVTWTSLIGLIIGVIPGAGASIASFVAYQQSRTFSKTPDSSNDSPPLATDAAATSAWFALRWPILAS